MADLSKIPHQTEMIPKGDERITPYLSDVLYEGDPDLVYRARDPKDLAEILRYCHSERIPVTVSGGRTGLTGAGVAASGLLVAMEKRDRILEVDPKKRTATAEPGILLGDFQRKIAEEGLFYPPDPTSRNEAQLGGTVGTNATGEDSLLYGPTRRYIRRLKYLTAWGEERVVERKIPYEGPTKNKGGYLLDGDPIELLIGSEGTLGIITEVTVDLLPASRPFFSAWGFFPEVDSALEFVVEARRTLKPRALELLDKPALEIISRQPRPPAGAALAGAGIIFKQEYRNEQERESLMEAWLQLLETILKKKNDSHLFDHVAFSEDPSTQEHFRRLRHAIPSTMNEQGQRLVADGGGKVATDWWVPVEKIRTMMQTVSEESIALGFPWIAFGHIGDGHPHINYLCRNFREKQKANELIERQCRLAVSSGGGVAGEHGIGKIYRNLLPIQRSSREIQRMKEIKKEFDPNGILGIGNLW